MATTSKHGSLLLRRATARQTLTGPLAIRSFSTTRFALAESDSKSKPAPVRRHNPLVGNYTAPPQPAQPKVAEAAPAPTKTPRKAAAAAAAPGASTSDLPPPPPPAASTSQVTPEQDPKHAYDASSAYVDIAKILENSANIYAKSANATSDPVNHPKVHTRPVSGRTVFIEGDRGTKTAFNANIAFRQLDRMVKEQSVKHIFNSQRFHERPGLKRKRLRMRRWRGRFKVGFKATVSRVLELKKQGW